jgi:hypothetical protein
LRQILVDRTESTALNWIQKTINDLVL